MEKEERIRAFAIFFFAIFFKGSNNLPLNKYGNLEHVIIFKTKNLSSSV